MIRLRWCGVVFAAVLGGAIPVHTHSLANTIVSVTMTPHLMVDVTIAAEADPLIAKLETLGGRSASEAPATSAERRARLESLVPTLRAHIDARVAGEPVSFELRAVDVDDTAQTSIHLTAPIPPGSATFTWGCTFIFGAYQLSTRSGNGVEAIEWLQGSQASKPVALQASPPGANRIAAGVAMTALVVFIIGRRAIAASGFT